MSSPTEPSERFFELQRRLGWTADDRLRIRAAAQILKPQLPRLVGELCDNRAWQAAGQTTEEESEGVVELKGTLLAWLVGLLSEEDGNTASAGRRQARERQLSAGLEWLDTNLAVAKLRPELIRELAKAWQWNSERLLAVVQSLNLLIDIEMTVIQEARLSKLLARLRQTERLATMGQAAEAIAQELRNPLNSVRTSVYHLRTTPRLTPEKLGEHLGHIDRQAGKAESILNALTNFARLPDPDLKPIDMRASLKHVGSSVDLPGHVEIQLQLGDEVEALGDAQQIQMVVDNLVRNAIEAMPDGGTLTITADQVGSSVYILVRDTGVGIHAADLQQVMEPLYTTKDRNVGLGLAIARAIIEKHGGRLAVQSEPGRGSTFTVELKSHTAP